MINSFGEAAVCYQHATASNHEPEMSRHMARAVTTTPSGVRAKHRTIRPSERPIITAERLRDEFTYNPDTGEFSRVKCKRSDFIGKKAGTIRNGYLTITVGSRQYLAHRLVWLYVHGRWPKGDLDHANRDTLDNRLANLREATRGQNNANAPASRANKIGLRGVFYQKHAGRWRAQIKCDGRTIHLGYFDTPEQAHAAYQKAARKIYGEFAYSAHRILAYREPV